MELTPANDRTEAADSRTRPRVAIVGGGPSGLMTAYLLERQRGIPWDITLFEAKGRLGGKLQTCRFERAPVLYEAGVAECYDYPAIRQDPLRTLVHDLGLRTSPNRSTTVVLNGCLIRDDEDIRRCFGERTLEVIRAFRRRVSAMLPLARWHRGFSEEDNRHPWADRTIGDILERLRAAQAKVTPVQAEAQAGLGRVALAQGRHEEALRLLGEADAFWTSFDPDNRGAGETAFWLARTLSALKRSGEAARAFERAAALLAGSPIPSDRALARIARDST